MCPPGAMCNYCRRTAEQMRERIVGDSGGSLDDWCLHRFSGVCAAPVDRAAAPPATKYQLPLFFSPSLFLHKAPGRLLIELLPPAASYPAKLSQVHEKDPAKLFSPCAASWKSSWACLGVDLLPGTSSDPDAASLNIVNLIPYLRAQKLLADRQRKHTHTHTHGRFIIPSLFAQTKHQGSYLKARRRDSTFILF